MLSLCPSIGGCESSSTSTYVPAAPVPAQKAVDQDPKLPPIKTGREAKAPAPVKKKPVVQDDDSSEDDTPLSNKKAKK